ncbi:MAG: hydrogenase maturation peptidase HycI [Elusimicrobia bacterium]|nr:hydrogenase maturation peptidase HycI [Elusimicrobiota bacterium]
MPDFKTILKKKLKDAKRIAFLGIGSELRGDDIAGLLVAEELSKFKSKKLKIFIGSTAPENITGEIKDYKPTHILIVDSMDADKKAGTITIINPEEVGGVSFSTHMLPIKMIVDYLVASLKCEIIIIGIQPKILKFDKTVSKEVKKSVKQISNIIKQIVQGK